MNTLLDRDTTPPLRSPEYEPDHPPATEIRLSEEDRQLIMNANRTLAGLQAFLESKPTENRLRRMIRQEVCVGVFEGLLAMAIGLLVLFVAFWLAGMPPPR